MIKSLNLFIYSGSIYAFKLLSRLYIAPWFIKLGTPYGFNLASTNFKKVLGTYSNFFTCTKRKWAVAHLVMH